MIDNDDVEWAAILSGGGGLFGLAMLVVFVFVAFQACRNEDICAERHCDKGTPVLTNHDCFCQEKAR